MCSAPGVISPANGTGSEVLARFHGRPSGGVVPGPSRLQEATKSKEGPDTRHQGARRSDDHREGPRRWETAGAKEMNHVHNDDDDAATTTSRRQAGKR
jgi:hypothetical protein